MVITLELRAMTAAQESPGSWTRMKFRSHRPQSMSLEERSLLLRRVRIESRISRRDLDGPTPTLSSWSLPRRWFNRRAPLWGWPRCPGQGEGTEMEPEISISELWRRLFRGSAAAGSGVAGRGDRPTVGVLCDTRSTAVRL